MSVVNNATKNIAHYRQIKIYTHVIEKNPLEHSAPRLQFFCVFDDWNRGDADTFFSASQQRVNVRQREGNQSARTK